MLMDFFYKLNIRQVRQKWTKYNNFKEVEEKFLNKLKLLTFRLTPYMTVRDTPKPAVVRNELLETNIYQWMIRFNVKLSARMNMFFCKMQSIGWNVLQN